MKNTMLLLIILIICFLPNCKNGLRSLYSVHDEIPYLNITYMEPEINPESIIKYLDTVVKNDSINYAVIISIYGDNLNKDQRILTFKNTPVESYRISCNAEPCWIMSISNKTLDKSDWISDKTKLQKTEIDRIKKRFKTEILKHVPKHN
jgi:hypothetical protein